MSSGNKQLELDRERVTCLLLINTQLMRKAINLYNNVLCNGQSFQSLPPPAQKSLMESYQNCTRRLHCNLSVLTYLHEKYHGNPSSGSNKVSFPIIMSPPQDMPELNQFYNKLQDLYPEAIEFLKLKIQQMRQKQFQQSNQSNSQLQPNQQQSQLQPSQLQQDMSLPMNPGQNPGLNQGINQGSNQQGINQAAINQGMNQQLNQYPNQNSNQQQSQSHQPNQQQTQSQQNFNMNSQINAPNNIYSPIMNNGQNKPQNFPNQFNGFNNRNNGNSANMQPQAMSPQQILQQANTANPSNMIDFFQ